MEELSTKEFNHQLSTLLSELSDAAISVVKASIWENGFSKKVVLEIKGEWENIKAMPDLPLGLSWCVCDNERILFPEHVSLEGFQETTEIFLGF